MLAYCFPAGAAVDTKDEKLDRLLTQLRSATVVDSGEPLSLHYQAKSQEILSLYKTIGESHGRFCELLLMEDSNFLLENNALRVGSFLYEYDSEYIEFLDGALSVLLSKNNVSSVSPNDTSLLSVSQLNQSTQSVQELKMNAPLLSHVTKIDSASKELPYWQQVIPLLERLHSWALLPNPQITVTLRRSRSPEGEQNGQAITSLKVNVPPKLVLKCLKLKEAEHQKIQNDASSQQFEVTFKSHNQEEPFIHTHIDSTAQQPEGQSEQNVSLTDGVDGVEGTPTNANITVPPQLLELPPGTLEVHVCTVCAYMHYQCCCIVWSCSVFRQFCFSYCAIIHAG